MKIPLNLKEKNNENKKINMVPRGCELSLQDINMERGTIFTDNDIFYIHLRLWRPRCKVKGAVGFWAIQTFWTKVINFKGTWPVRGCRVLRMINFQKVTRKYTKGLLEDTAHCKVCVGSCCNFHSGSRVLLFLLMWRILSLIERLCPVFRHI